MITERHVYYCIGLAPYDLLQLKYQATMEEIGGICDIIHNIIVNKIVFGGIDFYGATKFRCEIEAREALEEIKKNKDNINCNRAVELDAVINGNNLDYNKLKIYRLVETITYEELI